MSRFWFAPIAISVALIGVNAGRADDQAAARAVVDKAIMAMGGEANLAKIKAATFKGKGKFYGLGGEGLDYTGDWAFQGIKQMRVLVDLDFMGQKVSQTVVLNSDKGWIKTGAMAAEMDKDVLAEQQEQSHANWVAYVNPAALKHHELSLVGEAQIDSRPAVGVRAVSKGHRDLNLYFDKETGLLLKGEWRVKDTQGLQGGKEVTQEVFPSDYKEINGVKRAMKVIIKWDGKPYVDAEMSDFQFVDKLDDDVFAKP
jgi:hypothetical protein